MSKCLVPLAIMVLVLFAWDARAFSTFAVSTSSTSQMTTVPSGAARSSQWRVREVTMWFSSKMPRSTAVTVLYSRSSSSVSHETEDTDEHPIHQDSDDDESTASSSNKEEKVAKKIVGRMKRVKYGYTLMTMCHVILAFLTLLRYRFHLVGFHAASSGPVTASVMSFVLGKAATADRLGSDTYKRLNLALVLYGMMGLVSVFLDPKRTSFFGSFATITVAITTINCIKGYGYGAKGWKLQGGMSVVASDIKKGFLSTFKIATTLPPKNPISWGLEASVITTITLCLVKAFFVGQSVLSRAPLAMLYHLSGCAKFCLTAATALTLKDAADRDRLDGTTFIQLNILQATVFATFAARIALFGINPPPIIALCSIFYAAVSAFAAWQSISRKKAAQ